MCLGAQDASSSSALKNTKYNGQVIRVIDGDTVEVRIDIWLQQSITTKLRIRGVDAPELRSRCSIERDRALNAKEFLINIFDKNPTVVITHVEPGKYGGRVIANILTADGRDISSLLIQKKLVVSYDGGSRKPWC